jgi:hypothetical protein
VLPSPPHYERAQPHIQQGDIGYFPFSQLVRPDEVDTHPGARMPPTVHGVPVFEGMVDTLVTTAGVDYLLRSWHGLGIVVDVTSELANSPQDNRVSIAPLVPVAASGLRWDLAESLRYAGVIPLPAAERDSISTGFPVSDWPAVVGLPRSVATVSRRIVESGRMMTLSPRMAVLLAAKLAEMFGTRQWARMKHFANVEGQRLLDVVDVAKPDSAPTKGRWVVLNFENHERMQVFVSPRD